MARTGASIPQPFGCGRPGLLKGGMRVLRPLLYAVVTTAIFHAAARAGDHWPAWRGPSGDGHSDEKNLPLSWGGKQQENILWKSPLFPSDKVRRDQNQSSPIVWSNRVFVTVSY